MICKNGGRNKSAHQPTTLNTTLEEVNYAPFARQAYGAIRCARIDFIDTLDPMQSPWCLLILRMTTPELSITHF